MTLGELAIEVGVHGDPWTLIAALRDLGHIESYESPYYEPESAEHECADIFLDDRVVRVTQSGEVVIIAL